MERILIFEDKYIGKYVTLQNEDSDKVITFDESAIKAYNDAKKLGVESPILMYVPDGEVAYIL
ncbi:MAG: hypothetical protein A2086_12260 [Spirochaetes bacterium GWD1_27_9]|nr:MAG: hypothetical protein A2Z98_06640 [Spirochaetes bacterium GWB1_27_13]OHD26190.1 MAG: hypothetical protein A2Y34_09570 [Spirochaetes bacterium GWC1_27_15]OHD35753.1 MAG: hypothetical protein A2086_12260 [Spirochaetes bacterium GWD1_27_9]